jgi:hypothetical protein
MIPFDPGIDPALLTWTGAPGSCQQGPPSVPARMITTRISPPIWPRIGYSPDLTYRTIATGLQLVNN